MGDYATLVGEAFPSNKGFVACSLDGGRFRIDITPRDENGSFESSLLPGGVAPRRRSCLPGGGCAAMDNRRGAQEQEQHNDDSPHGNCWDRNCWFHFKRI